jgi:hypothetical protein
LRCFRLLGGTVKFREILPAGCPPKDAQDIECADAFRFIPAATAALAHFASNAAKQETPPPGIDACRWASCSLYTDMATVQKKRKLKKLRSYIHVAKLKIGAGSGYLIIANSHIDFWMFETFDPVAAVVHVEGL